MLKIKAFVEEVSSINQVTSWKFSGGDVEVNITTALSDYTCLNLTVLTFTSFIHRAANSTEIDSGDRHVPISCYMSAGRAD